MAVLGFIGMGNMGSAMLSGAKETFGKEKDVYKRQGWGALCVSESIPK